MENIRTEIASLLIDVEYEMRRLSVWSQQPPSAQALASEQPFCIDTLSFSEWMQFVFLVRMRALLEQGQTLPQRCGIAPMAEEYFRGQGLDVTELVRLLQAIDDTLSPS